MKTAEMECVLATWFDYRVNLIVPNVYWGMHVHECDLFIVSKAGYATEVEIKVSKADLLRDSEKKHNHDGGSVIKYLYFAVPEKLREVCEEVAPEHAGILTVAPKDANRWCRVRRVRDPVVNKAARKMTDADRYKVARLGALRIWKLKRKLAR